MNLCWVEKAINLTDSGM